MQLPYDIDWRWAAAALVLLLLAALLGIRWYRERARRRSLLARLQRISQDVVHQVLIPDGMGGHFHIDHLLLTPRAILVLDVRRVNGVIFGGDQMSDWTVMARDRRFTFDNPQPALYDRVAAVKAIAGDAPVEGRLLFSSDGKFAKGSPKWVVTLTGLEAEFPMLERNAAANSVSSVMRDAWARVKAQLAASPHQPTKF
jgi:Nuclease-related domain